MVKKLAFTLICLAVVTFGAIKTFERPSASQVVQHDSASLPNTEQSQQTAANVVNAIELNSDKKVTTSQQHTHPNKTDLNQDFGHHYADEGERLAKLIASISSVDGISQDAATALMATKDFYDVIHSLEKNDAESFTIHNQFEDNISESIRQNNFNASVYAFNCNDIVCAAAITYEDSVDVENLINKSFPENGPAISIVAQPVMFNGTKELRVILNYATAAIVIN
ncbi:MAG: hypothetical protein KKE30_07940 [Gammaproteobacteria bacterium]|nr:hypothetical protein [Gammaproteobacteria bacterium]MBU1555974.1 hypothetical protein [Gammaproteobacteria bacterium]MBU2070229.1 hypothetical protein [Gammaproteobacteria bacterium]MBU2182284.1 hypothetical protein [Gammaproteobacteria bacterium]MBU2206736.1 hypothetical protein [Gammaproteobacteria bacterium]